MGDIFRKVDLWGLSEGGELRGRVQGAMAIVDTGATRTVISRGLGLRLGGPFVREESFEKRKVPIVLALVRLRDRGCEPRAILVAVDDELADRAGTDRQGKKVEIILGHDYLEAEGAAVRYRDRGDEVVCKAAGLRRLRKR